MALFCMFREMAYNGNGSIGGVSAGKNRRKRRSSLHLQATLAVLS